jgi:hypothetical protein
VPELPFLSNLLLFRNQVLALVATALGFAAYRFRRFQLRLRANVEVSRNCFRRTMPVDAAEAFGEVAADNSTQHRDELN